MNYINGFGVLIFLVVLVVVAVRKDNVAFVKLQEQ